MELKHFHQFLMENTFTKFTENLVLNYALTPEKGDVM